MKKTIILSIFGCTAIAVPNVRGQSGPDIINSSGGYAVVGGRTFEWSIAEMVVTTEVGGSVIVTQGLLQPIDSALTSVPVTGIPSSQLTVYPNPTKSIVNISFDAPASGNLSYKLLDMAGRLIAEDSNPVSKGSSVRQVDLGKLANANYMLQVFYTEGDKSSSSTFKIQKIN
ncbi:MAG: T9SS type A sorting domain-containing protein [Taibaiella sp.]|nr:T9SS type A sorting domain-containing protein [Taibaiella sp.]